MIDMSQRREKGELPLAPIDRIIHQEGGERVSIEAAQLLRGYLEELGRRIARNAAELARHAGRKTITKEDMELAIKIYERYFAR